jgi:catechol 2,3-dioxygenase-like lactoylglutathione lyase family enzyme
VFGDRAKVADMAIARFKDLCIDAVDPDGDMRFWSEVLGLRVLREDDNAWLAGSTPQQVIWVNQVPEPKAVKNRVHLDVFAYSLSDLQDLGARFVEQFEHWTVMTDPDGQEFCAFLRDEVGKYRLKDLVVDSQDPEPIARWWHKVLGGVLDHHPDNPWWWIDKIPGAPFESLDFVEVEEPKTVKNRVHWDVLVPSLQPLIDAGATLLRPRGGDISWHVMADPDGNEFCAFTD